MSLPETPPVTSAEAALPLVITLDRPWLRCDLQRVRRVLSWSLNRPGFVNARHILWREVRDADLTPEFDAGRWFAEELARRGDSDAVGLLTSRNVTRYRNASAEVEDARAHVVVTLGLSNAERVGQRISHGLPPRAAGHGTINIAAVVEAGDGLSDGAMVEAMAIVAQARTVAVLAAGFRIATGAATGTGTDCIALAADPGALRHAGMHTAIGEVLGRAVLEATTAAVTDWMAEVHDGLPSAARGTPPATPGFPN